MSETSSQPPSPIPLIGTLTLPELWVCLKAGARDFWAAPQFGLFFSAVYVIAGFGMLWLKAGHVSWILVLSLGFPLAAPFAAVGLYEVSRRLEAGEALNWGDVLGVVWMERTRQVPWIGVVIVFAFLTWTFLAHIVFALFMGLSTLTNISTAWDVFFTPTGLMMIAVEMVLGGIVAFLLFSLTVVSLPLVLDKEIDFMTAMLLSMKCVRANLWVMLVWAAVIAALTLGALIPWFLGLIVVLPVLGHATWHVYRRALYDPV